MTLAAIRRRLLLIAQVADRAPLRALIADRLPAWEVVEADSVERARPELRLDPWDVLMLDASLARTSGALEWITEVQPRPVVMLADGDIGLLRAALDHGASHWLPRALALSHPALLAAVLCRAAKGGEVGRQLREAETALADCNRQIGRLVNRLWETVPSEPGANWFTQRYMLERLEEEVLRVKRHGGPLAVVLGELLPAGRLDVPAAQDLATVAAEQVKRRKRRTDVAGQYGPHGFMMLLPRTAEPGALACCERLRTLLEQPPWPVHGPLRACFGVAGLDNVEEATITKLLSRAEERLEAARGRRG
jgi:GGDEF domain-containing protein